MAQQMARLHPFLKPLWLRPLFWAALLFSFVAATMPASDAPAFSSSDKIEHRVTFVVLTLLLRAGYRRLAIGWVVAAMAVYGAAIEVTQMIPALHRDADVMDWVADMSGVGIAVLILLAVRALAAKRD